MSVIVTAIALVFLIPCMGFMVDVGFLYWTKARLQGAVDGASLAAARSLSLGQSPTQQVTEAKQDALNWFYANYPALGWMNSNVGMDLSDTHVHVYNDSAVPYLRHVDVMASTDVRTIFMRMLGTATVTVKATGSASRRDVNAMLVLDRSGSMGTACPSLLDAAKVFTGQLSAGRDHVGLISFADNAYLHSAPTSNFQTKLGYKNTFGSATGEIDSVVCGGGTNTPQAISMAYNELYKAAEPGALNIIVFETDGLPNTVTVNFWDSANSTAGISNSSKCTDRNGKKKSSGGFATAASLPSWTSGHSMNTGGVGYMGDIPAGIVGGIGVNGSTYFLLYNSWTTVKTNNFNENADYPYVTTAAGCTFSSSHGTTSDLAWLPTKDIYGNLLTGYKTVTTSGGRPTISTSNVQNGAINASDAAAKFARTNPTLPVFFLGIGFTSSVDHVLMQRMTNDPSWLTNSACTAGGAACLYNNAQPQGTYVFANTTQDLVPAFLALSSQVLRLNQ